MLISLGRYYSAYMFLLIFDSTSNSCVSNHIIYLHYRLLFLNGYLKLYIIVGDNILINCDIVLGHLFDMWLIMN